MPLPRRTIYESITADGPQTYTDGYGTTRTMYESPIVTGLRNFHHWINGDQTLSDEAYLEKYGFNKPSTSAGILDLMKGPAEAAKAAKAVGKAAGVIKKKPRIIVKNSPKPQYVQNHTLSEFYAEENNAKKAKEIAEIREYKVKQNQKLLDKELDRLAKEQGINTPGQEKKAMMKAVEINPETVSPPFLEENPAEIPLPIYKSGTQRYEGYPLREWFDMATEGMLPQGPNAAWRKLEKPFQSASNYFDTVGPTIYRQGIQAPKSAMKMLNEGLSEAAKYIKKEGGVLSAKSGIHIKKENRGKFTSYCGGKVTSECIARGKRSSNPAIRKRATFAANARRWKHQYGGKIVANWVYNILNNGE